MNVYMQVAGYGLKMKASILSRELTQNTRLRTALLHYAHAFFNQVAQSAACAQSSYLGTAMLPLATDDP